MSVLCSKILDSTVSAISNLLSDKINVYDTELGSEIIGFHVLIHDLKEEDFSVLAGYNKMFNYEAIRQVCAELTDYNCNFNKRLNGYSYCQFRDVIKSFKSIQRKIILGTERYIRTTRSFAIVFDSWHCFSSISFLIRKNTLYVNFNMRKCTVFNHLYHDIYIGYYLGKILANSVRNIGIDFLDMNLNIDSLYIYGDKVNECREDVIQYVRIKK